MLLATTAELGFFLKGTRLWLAPIKFGLTCRFLVLSSATLLEAPGSRFPCNSRRTTNSQSTCRAGNSSCSWLAPCRFRPYFNLYFDLVTKDGAKYAAQAAVAEINAIADRARTKPQL